MKEQEKEKLDYSDEKKEEEEIDEEKVFEKIQQIKG